MPEMAAADSAQDQYTEPLPSPTGHKPKPGKDNNTGGTETGSEATRSSSEGTPGGPASTTPTTSDPSPSSGESAEEGNPDASGKKGKGNQPKPTAHEADATSELDKTVAQVPDDAIIASTSGGESGSSPLLWIVLGIIVLGAGSGFLVLRRRT